MRHVATWLRASLLAGLFATSASAATCSTGNTEIERTICRNANVGVLDRALNELYAQVLAGQSAAARRRTIGQQRAWLVHRDAACAADPTETCLSPLYSARLLELSRLGNRSAGETSGREPTKIQIPQGSWQAAPLVLNDREKTIPPAAIARQFIQMNLPAPGERVSLTGASLCLSSGDCFALSWERSTVSALEGATRLEQDLGLQSSQRVLVGRCSDPHRNPVELIARGNGDVSIIVGLCLPDFSDCWNHLARWIPLAGGAQGR